MKFEPLIVAVCLFLTVPLAAGAQAQPTGSISETGVVALEDIAGLLRGLDDKSFRQRELATAKLVDLGEPAIGPLVRHALDASPEATRRIKICLEQIGTAGNESTFYKAVSLISLLFGGGNEETEARIQRLESEWNAKQTQHAINELTRLGAEFTVANLPVSEPGVIDVRPFLISKPRPPVVVKPKSKSRVQHKRSSKSEASKQIDDILAASLEENRKRVLAARADDVEAETPSSNQAVINELERQIQLLERGVNIVHLESRQGTQVVIGRNWKGKPSDLAYLARVSDLTSVAFQRHDVDRGVLERLKPLKSLNRVSFENCKISGNALATVGLPRKVSKVRFVRQKIDVSVIDRLGKPNTVNSIAFDHCIFSKAGFRKVFQQISVRELEFRGTRLDSAAFDRLIRMDQLKKLRLSGCKFSLADHKRFVDKRSNDVLLELVPGAFLGVRADLVGRRSEAENGCVISEVISNSSAERGGMLVGDRIESIDGRSVKTFDDLKTYISQYLAGDQIAIQVERNSELVDLTIRLGDFDDAPRF